MANQIPEWRLHIGVHKSATTHLQDSLLACRTDLLRHGVFYISRPRLHAIGFAHFLRTNELVRRGLRERLLLRTGIDCIRSRLARKSKGCRIALISEERILGRSVDLIDGFYPQLEQNLRKLIEIIDAEKVNVYLSIRNQSDILPSAYSQALRTHSNPKPFEVLLSRWLAAPPRWTDLIERIQTVLPNVSIKVWRFEDYVGDPAAVIEQLTGVSKFAGASLPRPERTARLSEEATLYLKEFQPLGLERDRKLEMSDQASKMKGNIYDPMTPDQKSLLTETYRRDLAEIAASGRLIGNSERRTDTNDRLDTAAPR